MIKLIRPEANEELLQACSGQLSTFYFEGQRTKSAASDVFTRQKINEFAPPPGKFMIHLITMGAHEMYGPNRNGDGFSKSALEKHHQTFVTHGHFFREHRNRDPKLAIGEIKAAAYHPKLHRVELIMWGDMEKAAREYERAKAGKESSYSMSCFPAGTLVRLVDGSEKPIETIVVGDEILTHKGNVGRVSDTMSHEHTGPGISLQAYGLPDPVICTARHGIWTRRKAEHLHECPVCGEHFPQLASHIWQKKDAQHMAAARDLERFSEGFAAAEDLLPGDCIRQAIDHSVGEDAPSADWATIAGYYLAEGSLFVAQCFYTRKEKRYGPYPNYRTEFTFNIKEVDYISELMDAIERVTGRRPSSHDYPEESRTVVRSHSKMLHDWLLENCGKYSHGKKMSQLLMHWHPNSQKVILQKWLAGDGDWNPLIAALKGTTVSRTLAWQMLEICGRLNLAASLCKDQDKNGKRAHKKKAYMLFLRGSNAEESDCDKVPSTWAAPVAHMRPTGQLRHQEEGTLVVSQSAPARSWTEAGFIYRRLRSVKKVFINEPVFDLTVPGDHGFMVHGYGVSNCRIKEDVCSCCQKKSARTSDYCHHLKDKMLQYLPEFEKYAFADNPEPTFFDSSDVERPADRIAHHLEYRLGDVIKKASAGDIILGTELAEMEGVSIPDGDSLTPAQLVLLQKMAHYETLLEALIDKKENPSDGLLKFASSVALNAFDGNEGWEDSSLDELRRLRPETLFYELAKRATILPFQTFAAYASGVPLSSVTNNADLADQDKHLSSCFRKIAAAMKDTSGVSDLVGLFAPGTSFGTSLDPENDHAVQWSLDALDQHCSCKKAHVENRALINYTGAPLTKSSIAERKSNKWLAKAKDKSSVQETSKSAAANIAEAYAFYKLAAVEAIIQNNPAIDPDAVAMLAVAQNI